MIEIENRGMQSQKMMLGSSYMNNFSTKAGAKKIPESGARKRALIACHFRPYPARCGTHLRCLMMLNTLQTLGYDVTLYSSNAQGNCWSQEDIALAEQELQINIAIHQPGVTDEQIRKLATSENGIELDWQVYTTPDMKMSFRKVYEEVKPQVVVVNYLFLANLAIGRFFESSVNIIDTLDLITLHMKLKSLVWNHLSLKPPFDLKTSNPKIVDEQLFESYSYSADRIEYELYDQYDCTIAINSQEKKLIQLNCSSTNVEYIPFYFKLGDVINTYTEPPVFVIGPNAFNWQGYLFFAEKVLPKVQEQIPDFVLQVIGDGSKYLNQVPGTELLGFVDDIKAVYSKSKFAICPMIGGTGQQAKVLEALAEGLPVIVLKNVAERCPIVNGFNGFIADDASQFADYIVKLSTDVELCRRLGEGARTTIAEEFSESVFLQKLQSLIEKPRKPKLYKFDLTQVLSNYLIQVVLVKFKYYKRFGKEIIHEQWNLTLARWRIRLGLRSNLKRLFNR